MMARIFPMIIAIAAMLSPGAVVAQELWVCLSASECRSGGGENESCETGSFPFELKISADGGSASMSLPEQELNLPLTSTASGTRTFEATVDESQFSIALGGDGAMKAIRINRYTFELTASCQQERT
jgi:hypothetical protein